MRACGSPLVALFLVPTIACSAGGPRAVEPCEPLSLISVGEELPDCSFAGVGDMAPLSLKELQGKPLVLNFWASWCSACVKEMPDFQNVFADLGHRVTIVGMNTLGLQGETEPAAIKFASSTGVRYPLAFDTDGLLYSHFRNAKSPLLPLTVFADADGIVRHTNVGQISERTLRELLAEHLGVE